MALSLKQKYDIIYSHEEQFAYRLGKEVISKPEVSVWMILLPVLFVHHLYRVNQYKAGIRSFAKGIVDPKQKALDKVYNEVSAGKTIEYEVEDYFPGIDLVDEKQKGLAISQMQVIQVMEKHYGGLLASSGQSYEELFKKVYPTQGDYRYYLNKLEDAEKNLYDYLSKKVHTTDASRNVIKDIRQHTHKMRNEEIAHFFA